MLMHILQVPEECTGNSYNPYIFYSYIKKPAGIYCRLFFNFVLLQSKSN